MNEWLAKRKEKALIRLLTYFMRSYNDSFIYLSIWHVAKEVYFEDNDATCYDHIKNRVETVARWKGTYVDSHPLRQIGNI